MKKRLIVTFIDKREFKREYMGAERHFVELSFLQHMQDGRLSAYKLLTTMPKLKNALDYRGLTDLTKSKKYELWLADYKGNGKLTFSGIKPIM